MSRRLSAYIALPSIVLHMLHSCFERAKSGQAVIVERVRLVKDSVKVAILACYWVEVKHIFHLDIPRRA